MLALAFLSLTLSTAGWMAAAPSASALTIAATTTCGNSLDNAGGLGVICEVEITNTITTTGGSAVVHVRECHGPAGVPATLCTEDTQTLTEPVTLVNQCNGSQNGGGGTMRCSVMVTNRFVDEDPNELPVTVNQCNGSGAAALGDDTSGCTPFPASTLGATITQCNGSANGLTLVGLTCSASGTESAAFAVTINQCNDSTNGGGALVICSADIETVFDAPEPTPTPTPTPAPEPTPTPSPSSSSTDTQPRLTQPPTDTAAGAILRQGNETVAMLFLMAVFGTISLGAIARRTFVRA